MIGIGNQAGDQVDQKVDGKAMTIRRPKTRYLVGSDAKIAGRFMTKLPDRLRDRLLSSR